MMRSFAWTSASHDVATTFGDTIKLAHHNAQPREIAMFGTRVGFIILLWIVTASVVADEIKPIDPGMATSEPENSTLWYNVNLLTIEGRGWDDTAAKFDRLPARAAEKVRAEVWNLSRHATGIAVRFVTDSPEIGARWTLTSANLAMPHMAATGVSGLDLYVRDDKQQWRWLACARPTKQTNAEQLIAGLPAGKREYMLYLPLYNGVSVVEVGIPKDKILAAGPMRTKELSKPIVFYGTSITQGGCASRPGMVHTAILGRRFDRPVINLGFSGNGRMETEVVEFIAELDAAVFVLDCLPNISADDVLARTIPCLTILRKQHPDTPILLVEDRTYSNAFLVAGQRDRNESSRKALRQVYEEMKATGDDHLFYLEGEWLLGDDNEGTVDGSHPTDLGFMRQASAFAAVLEPLLDAGTN